MREETVKIPLYFGNLVMIQCDDLKEVVERYNLKNAGYCAGLTIRHELAEGGVEFIMAYDKDVDNEVIAHECIHFINYLFIERGIELDRFNDEPQAYLMGWVFGQNERFINNKQ